jgi:selenocysteine lyase/cysteine desulfurase
MSTSLLLQRRGFLGSLAAFGSATLIPPAFSGERSAAPLPKPLGPIATDNPFWTAVRNLYEIDPAITNLENAYWGIMAKPILANYLSLIEKVNRQNSAYARSGFEADWRAAIDAISSASGFKPAEVTLTRGATEALQLLISNYNRLKPGDAVLYADLDYDCAQYAMEWLAERRSVDVIKIALPEPATRQTIIDTYAQAIDRHPKLKLILLTHLSHRTGLVVPVKEIAAIARSKGIDVILDAAHSWGQIVAEPKDLGVDFIAFNLHKWIGAPLGMGFMYIAEQRLQDVDPQLGDQAYPKSLIDARVHTGTFNFAAVMALPDALTLHAEIGAAAKAARLRYLRDLWVSEARRDDRLQILTPDDADMVGGITSFRLKGPESSNQIQALVAALRDKHKILTVVRNGVSKGPCIRVSPAIYTSEDDVLKFVAALRSELVN